MASLTIAFAWFQTSESTARFIKKRKPSALAICSGIVLVALIFGSVILATNYLGDLMAREVLEVQRYHGSQVSYSDAWKYANQCSVEHKQT
jgi:hypothetical protein